MRQNGTVPNDVPSIRIEPEHPGEERDRPSNNQSGNTDFGRRAVLAGVAAIGLVVLIIVALRPEPGRTADGSARQAPTTTVVDETETATTEPPQQQGPIAAQIIELDDSIREVADASIGYLGVLEVSAPRAQPPVIRSVDGVDWSPVESVVIEPDDLDLLRSRFAAFIGLRTTETGFSVLRVRQLFAAPGRSSTGLFVTDRLLSADGVEWAPDSTFNEITARQSVRLPTGGSDLLLSVTPSIPDALERRTGKIDRTNAQALPELECSLRGSSIDREFIDSCDAEASDSTPEPPCSSDYVDSVEQFEFAVVNPASIEGVYFGRGLITSPEVVVGTDEVSVVVAIAGAISSQPAGCVGDVVDPRSIGLAIWEGSTSPARHVSLDLAGTSIDSDALRDAVAVGPLDDSLLVTTGDALLSVHLDGSVEVLGALDGVDLDVQVPRAYATSDGLMLVDVRDGVLRSWEVDATGVMTMQQTVLEQAGFGNVRFADANIVLLSGPSQDQAIQLPERN